MSKLEQEWRSYNKRMRKNYLHFAQFDTVEEYAQYKKGKYKPKEGKFVEYKPKETYRRETKEYPSVNTMSPSQTPRAERKEYTGDLIVGIGTMHKSNAIPIMRDTEQAKELARMRR